MRRALLLTIQTLLSSVMSLDEQKAWIQIWNNQFEKTKETDEEGNKIYAINMPAVFLEIITNDIQQLGNGCQYYDLDFNLHIIHRQLDAGDGTIDQNLDVFDLAEHAYNLVQARWPGSPFGQVCRIGETEDENHDDLYHFIQRYGTTYVDSAQNQPVGGILSTPPTALDITGVVIDENPADYPQ